MDKINVNATVGKDYNLKETEEKGTTPFQQGDIVEGIITGVSDMISITFNDKEVKVPLSAVQNAKEGQIRNFEIKDISNQSIVLREVGINTEEITSGVLQTNVYTGGKAFSGYIREKSGDDLLEKSKEVKSQMDGVSSTLTVSDYVNLAALDKSPEESSSEEFEKNLERIKEQRQFTEEHIERQRQKLDAKTEEITKAAISSAAGSDASEIAKRLEQADLPVTKANIAKVSTALEMVSQAANLDDNAKAFLMDEQKIVNPENIYKAMYSGSKQPHTNSSLSEEEWKELEPKVLNLLHNAGLEGNEEQLTSAKWLINMDLPVNQENIDKLSILNELQSQKDSDKVLDLCIQGMKQGSSPKEANLIEAKKELDDIDKTISTMHRLGKLTEEDAEKVPEEETVSIQTIEMYQQTTATTISASEKAANQTIDIKNVSARRQLAEVQQMLTMESCYRLYQQGIEVDTASMEELITELKNMEQSYYSEYYMAAGMTPNDKQLSWLQATNQVVTDLKTMPNLILGATFTMRSRITLTGLYEAGEAFETEHIEQSGKQVSAYDTLMTAPRKDLGDSMKKAFASVDALLDDLGLAPTEGNRQAVRILGYNAMDITAENIEQMKQYQMEVQNIVDHLTPEVAVNIIREGENPLQVPLEELNQKLQAIQESLTTSSEEKFSEYLYKLDQKKGLTEDERDAYIGVYRLLYQVEKSDGAAVGAVVKAGQNLTLGNLLTAVRSKKMQGMDIEVADDFGGVDVVSNGTKITEQINKVFYGRQMTHEVYNKLEPDTIDMAYEAKTMESFMDLEIEDLYEATNALNQSNTESEYTNYKYNELLTNYGRTKEAAVLVATGQEVTANQLEAAGLLMAEGSTVYRDIRNQAKELGRGIADTLNQTYGEFVEQIGDSEGLEESFGQVSRELTTMLEQAMESSKVDANQVEALRKYHNCIRLAGNLSSHQTFELPVVLGEDVVNLKVQLVEGQQETPNLKFQMHSPEYGTVDALAVVQDHSVSGYLVCENRQVAETMLTQEPALRQEMESMGYTTNQFTISMNRRTKDFYRSDMTEQPVGDKPTNQNLYQLAKIFVKYTQHAMSQEKKG